MEAILSRHSVRNFTDESVSEDQLIKLVHAGMSAPSAMNSRPWHFIIVNDRKILNGVSDIHPYAQMSKQAAAGILVCGEPSKEIIEMYFQQDCSNAAENILIAASDLGLGAVWVGLYPDKDHIKNFKKYFKIPENIEPFAWIPIGHPTVPSKPDNRLDSSKIHRNMW